MRKKRHNYTPEEKVSILRRHLVEHVAVSDLCDEYQLQPKIFYIWQKQFFENGAAAFVREDRPQKRVEEARIQQLEAKLTRKHEVLSELMEEHIKLKKGSFRSFRELPGTVFICPIVRLFVDLSLPVSLPCRQLHLLLSVGGLPVCRLQLRCILPVGRQDSR